jgi:trafficking protein particle complex subunit 5
MISDNEPLVNQYISVPREMSQLNCAAFVAGIVEGVCDGAGFKTLGVSAHWAAEGGDNAAKVGQGGMWPGKTIFLIKFAPEVLEREELLAKER